MSNPWGLNRGNADFGESFAARAAVDTALADGPCRPLALNVS